MPTPPIIIAIGRELGSGGSLIGQRVARRLQIAYVDREIFTQAAQHLGVDERDLAHREERVSSFWERLVAPFAMGSPDEIYARYPPPVALPDAALFEAQKRVMRELATDRDCVIIGHGAFHVLKGEPGLIKVFVLAPVAFRVKPVREMFRLQSDDEARALIAKVDGDRERFIREMTGCAWRDCRHYDLCIDTCRVGIELAEDLIVRLVEQRRTRLGVEPDGPECSSES